MQFGRPISEFQLVQAMLADMYTQIEAARSLSLRTAAMCEGLEEGEGGRGEEGPPVAEAAAVAPEPVLTTPSVHSTRAPPRLHARPLPGRRRSRSPAHG